MISLQFVFILEKLPIDYLGGLEMTFIRKTTMGLLVLSLATVLSACGMSDENETESSNGSNATVSISGSTSVGPLAEKLAAKYTETR